MQHINLEPIIAKSEELFAAATTQEGPATLRKPRKVLEIACGTGRFMTFVQDNLPLDAECTALYL